MVFPVKSSFYFSSIKNILEDANFEISGNISNHQPVWNNDKIVTFLDIGGVGNENSEDSPGHSPQVLVFLIITHICTYNMTHII